MNTQPKTARRHIARPRITPGAPPGSLHAVPGSAPARITLLTIKQGIPCAPHPLSTLSNLPVPENDRCHWVRVTGLGALEPLQVIREFYGIRPMALEDILSPGWRSKVEQSGDFLFMALQAPPGAQSETKNEYLFVLYKAGLIITFEDTPTTLIDTLWQRISAAPTPKAIGSVGAYLAYATLDLIIDRFFPLLYKTDEALAELEDSIVARVPTLEEINRLHKVKRDLLTLRRLLTPYHELELAFRQIHLVQTVTDLVPYLNDLRNHITQAVELVEAYHDIASSLNDIYQSTLTNRMNDIIKLLTIISTIFMPLTFLAGVYGMNFHNMPELSTTFGYPIVLGVMLAIMVGMLWFFRKKKWF